jgi:chaperonin GroES
VNLKPLFDNVVVEHVEQQDKSSGGVFLPDTAKEKAQEGVIQAVGPGRVTDKGSVVEMHVKVGDRVLYRKYSGSEIKIDGTEYLIIPEKDILAIVDKVPAGV